MGMKLNRHIADVDILSQHRDLLNRQQREFEEDNEILQTISDNMEEIDENLIQQFEKQREEAYQITLEMLTQAQEAIKSEQLELKHQLEEDINFLEKAIQELSDRVGTNSVGRHLERAILLMKNQLQEYYRLLMNVEQASNFDFESAKYDDFVAAREWNSMVASDIVAHRSAIQGMLSMLTASDEQETAMKTYCAQKSFIQQAMRNGTVVDNEELMQTVKDLHSLLVDKKTTQDITVYSKATTDIFSGMTDEELVGRIVADGSFIHASILEKETQSGDTVMVLHLPKGTPASTTSFLANDNVHVNPLPGTDINLETKLELQNGIINQELFKKEDGQKPVYAAGLKLEEITKRTYDYIDSVDPAEASRILTNYNLRHIPVADWHDAPRNIQFEKTSIRVVDSILREEQASIIDDQGNQYDVFPNPMTRVNNMFGNQGKNSLGMHEDCGIASTAKAINDLYGTTVTTENRLAQYAKRVGSCEWIDSNPQESGGTWESSVQELYKANGLIADAFRGNAVPSVEALAQRIKCGEAATVAVNANIFLNNNQGIHQQGVFPADHYVNISNVVYDKQGNFTHFIVCDTGDGKTKMVAKDEFSRAYRTGNGVRIPGAGCIIARKAPNMPKPLLSSNPPVATTNHSELMLDFQQAFKIRNVEWKDGKRYVFADALFCQSNSK